MIFKLHRARQALSDFSWAAICDLLHRMLNVQHFGCLDKNFATSILDFVELASCGKVQIKLFIYLISLILKWAAALANLFTLVAAAKAYPLPDGIISVIRFCQAVLLFIRLFLMNYILAPDSDQNCHVMCCVI